VKIRFLFLAAGLLLTGCAREVKRPELEMPLIDAIAEHTTYKTIENTPSVYIVSVRRGSMWRIESRTFDGSHAQVLVCDGRSVRAMYPELLKKQVDVSYINARFDLIRQIYNELDQFKFGGIVKLDDQKCWKFEAMTGSVLHFNKRSGYLARMENKVLLTEYFPVQPKLYWDDALYSTATAPKSELLPEIFGE
jgi:hypothetical protein